MMRALSIAATGLEAQQTKIANLANDMANVNTDGYKQTQTEFQDLAYQTFKEPGGPLGPNSNSPVGVQVGMGVKVGASHARFEQGPAKITNNPFDLMINGQGFFPVQTPQGELAYSRSGNFDIDAQGVLQLSSGAKLNPPIVIPMNVSNVSFSPLGEVKGSLPGGAETVLGQVRLVQFQNPEGLVKRGENLYLMSTGSGTPQAGMPGENGLGVLQQGALEGSTVDVAKGMVEMITTQRAYEMGAKLMGVADQMLGATVNVK